MYATRIDIAKGRFPQPPYYAVIFTSRRTDGDNDYAATAENMLKLAADQPGFLGVDWVRESPTGFLGVDCVRVGPSWASRCPTGRTNSRSPRGDATPSTR
jgi:hypothetical protein